MMKATPTQMNQGLAIALLLPFLLGMLSTDVSHCSTACDDCSDATITESLRVLTHHCEADHDQEHVHIEGEDSNDTSDSDTCLGATCLCHQTPHLTGGAQQLITPPFELEISTAPRMLDLGVTEEILHVPKVIA